jgi:hypothetical protein
VKASEARDLLAPVVELELDRVVFGPRYVSMELSGTHNLSLRLNKSFEVVSSAFQHTFNIESNAAQSAASALVACIGAKVTTLELAPSLLSVPFSNGWLLQLALAHADFEPLELSCSHHMAPNELKWFSTVEAG